MKETDAAAIITLEREVRRLRRELEEVTEREAELRKKLCQLSTVLDAMALMYPKIREDLVDRGILNY